MRVEAFSVMRTYSSSPSRRCAFSMLFALLLHRSFSEFEHSAIGIGQAELVGPPFPVMNDLGVALLFNKGCHMLDRPQAGDVLVLSVSEDAIKQSCGA